MLASLLLSVTLATQAAAPSAPSAATAAAATPSAVTSSLSTADMSRFLATAKVVGHHGIDRGITHPIRLTLSDGTVTHDAAFTYVNEHRPVMALDNGRTEVNFVDSYKYSLAAYGLAQLLKLDDMMPVTVPYEWDRQPGALSWWVDVMMEEGERVKKKIEAPDENIWGQQVYRMRVFSALVADTDRNAGNILIGPDWKLWMIDFTRAFRTWKNVEKPEQLNRCDKRLLGRLRVLSAQSIAEHTNDNLTKAEIDALLARRDGIVKLFDDLIARNGAAKVLY
jgi:hypothetical protein